MRPIVRGISASAALDSIGDCFFALDREWRFTYVNRQAELFIGRSREDLIGTSFWEAFPGAYDSTFGRECRRAVVGQTTVEFEALVEPRAAWCRVRAYPSAEGLALVLQNIGERRRSELRLIEKTEQLQAIADALSAFLEHGSWREASGVLLRAALRQTESVFGFAGVVVEGPVLRILAQEGIVWDSAGDRDVYEAAPATNEQVGSLELDSVDNLCGAVITNGSALIANDLASHPRAVGLPPGHPPLEAFLGVPITWRNEVVGMIGVANRPGGYGEAEQRALEMLTQMAGVLYDSYRREERQTLLEEQLRRSQKMEAIGRLAGGIAHDFNNLLTVIGGYSAIALAKLAGGRPLEREIVEISKAAESAASLTRQLLAFSRSQVLQPKALDLNAVVVGLRGMLRRLLSDDIELETRLAEAGAPVKVDPGQIEQVIVNLAVNARDAMPGGGRLTIETQTVDLDRALCRGKVVIPPGRYVTLVVTDTGSGIDAEVQERIFEPFFTTKDGKGTGLGLATVYGIVEQSNGSIVVDSAPGRGSRFTVYLPRAEEPVESEIPPESSSEAPLAQTVMVVEDQDAVRRLVCEILEGLGCVVLAARDGEEALDLARSYEGEIALLLTDVVMPGMSGRDLASRFARLHPGAAVLYMSGYTQQQGLDVGAQGGTTGGSGQAVDFIAKPFSPQTLRTRVRELLDAVPSPTGG